MIYGAHCSPNLSTHYAWKQLYLSLTWRKENHSVPSWNLVSKYSCSIAGERSCQKIANVCLLFSNLTSPRNKFFVVMSACHKQGTLVTQAFDVITYCTSGFPAGQFQFSKGKHEPEQKMFTMENIWCWGRSGKVPRKAMKTSDQS